MHTNFKHFVLAVILTAAFAVAGLCMEPPGPGEIEQYRADGSLAERQGFMQRLQNNRFHPALVERKIARLNAGKQIQPRSLPYATGASLSWRAKNIYPVD